MPTENYIPQPEPETKLWRYMDFAKFISMVHTSALFFCQVKRLGDSFEGSLEGWIGEVKEGSDFERELRAFYNHPKGLRAYSAVSCWHMNQHESPAMWKLYLSSNQGLAIQSSVKRLGESLGKMREGTRILKGAIIYSEIPQPPPGDPEGISGEIALFRKQPYYSYENEYRVAIVEARQLAQLDSDGGLTVDIDLDTLIERIYVAPTSPRWIKHLVNSILETKYNLRKPVVQSDLDREANW